MEKNDLNLLLENLFADVTHDNGKQLGPISLCVMQAALDRYLKENGCTFSILKYTEFKDRR